MPEPLVNEPSAPDQTREPGILDTLGRWLGDSKAKFDEGIKSTRDAIGGIGSAATGAAKDAAGAAQQATDAIVSLPGTRIVSGRERCAIAANGGPDCADAASALCRAKGFGSGTGLDINSTHKCPAWVWWSNRRPIEHECKTVTFVLRAVCQ